MSSRKVTRRKFIGNTTFMAVGLPVMLGRAYPAFAAAQSASGPYSSPKSPRTTLNFNLDWRFIREDVPNAEVPDFDDSKWTAVATPHSFNDVDSFRKLISHGGGDMGTYKGLSWYRKHFKLPAALAGNRVFLEFEGMRQAGDIFLNGKQVGLYENGVTAYGIDITDAVHLGAQENVLAVKVDNTTAYKERAFCMANPKNAEGTPCVGAGTTSIPTTAASTAMSGCMSRARSTRPCRSTTVWRARASTSTPTTSTSPRRPPTSPSTPRSTTPPANAPRSASPPSSSTSTAASAPSSRATP